MKQLSINTDLSENVAYNKAEFPVYIRHGTLSTYPEYRAVCHWHTDFEFIYVFDGTMNYNVNGAVTMLKPGQGIFVNSNCLHYGFSENRSECHFLCILLNPELLSSNHYFCETILDPLTKNADAAYIKLKQTSSWQNAIILELLRIEDNYGKQNEALHIIQSFISILSYIISNVGRSFNMCIENDEISTLTEMIGFIQKNYPDPISIQSLSEMGRCCKTKCNNLFRKYLSISPLNYLIEYRLNKSTELLKTTQFSIAEIACSCGFAGSSYYCEIFKKHYGLTPKQYRSNYQHIRCDC